MNHASEENDFEALSDMDELFDNAGKPLSRFILAIENQKNAPDVYQTMLALYMHRMDAYTRQTRSQAERSFNQAKNVSTAGFILIAIGIIIGLVSLFIPNLDNSVWVAVMTTSSGVIIEITAGTFFVIFNRSLTGFMKVTGLLTEMQNCALSLMCVETVTEDGKRDTSKADLIKQIIAKDFSDLAQDKNQ